MSDLASISKLKRRAVPSAKGSEYFDVSHRVMNGRSDSSIRRIHFTLPFKKAMAKAKAENRLLFLKPIYGGVDEIGARDYRAGNW